MNSPFHLNVLSNSTSALVTKIQAAQPDFLKNFYLSGGTGLALQIGHRESIDLDFFSPASFDSRKLEIEISKLGQLSDTELEQGTLNTFVDGVKLQFLHYNYPLIEATSNWQGMNISSVLDIACTKLQTVSMRGSKKDFIDLFFIFDRYSLPNLLENAKTKYVSVNYNQTHILKSLVYFDDAETQPMPKMHQEVAWEDVKARMINEVKKISFT